MDCRNYIPDHMTVEVCIELANPTNYWLVLVVVCVAIVGLLVLNMIKMYKGEA